MSRNPTERRVWADTAYRSAEITMANIVYNMDRLRWLPSRSAPA